MRQEREWFQFFDLVLPCFVSVTFLKHADKVVKICLILLRSSYNEIRQFLNHITRLKCFVLEYLVVICTHSCILVIRPDDG